MNYIVAFFIGAGLAVWVAQSRDEAERYNESHRQEISIWEAMFLNYNDETP